MSKYDELKRLAADLPAPWITDADEQNTWHPKIRYAGDDGEFCGPVAEVYSNLNLAASDPRMHLQMKQIARFIAAANPAAILELIAENERLTSGTSRLSAKLSRQIVRNRQAFHLIDEMKNAWISVEDRLPQERQAVLAYCIGSESVGVAWLHADGQWLIPEPQALGADCITHWMALPSAPVIAEGAA
jgi:hypothetical protein